MRNRLSNPGCHFRQNDRIAKEAHAIAGSGVIAWIRLSAATGNSTTGRLFVWVLGPMMLLSLSLRRLAGLLGKF